MLVMSKMHCGVVTIAGFDNHKVDSTYFARRRSEVLLLMFSAL